MDFLHGVGHQCQADEDERAAEQCREGAVGAAGDAHPCHVADKGQGRRPQEGQQFPRQASVGLLLRGDGSGGVRIRLRWQGAGQSGGEGGGGGRIGAGDGVSDAAGEDDFH